MDPIEQFKHEVQENIRLQGADKQFRDLSMDWIRNQPRKYTYNFTWMGRPILQYPQDIMAMQELIWMIQPDLIIETGIAHGGSLIFYASMLELIGGKGKVLGIDIDIRAHNRKEIENHPMIKRIEMIEGSSVCKEVTDKVRALAQGKSKVMVCLDSYHSHEHVLAELNAYAPLVTPGSYCVVFDTIVEDLYDSLSDDFKKNQPWDKMHNPKTAVREFLGNNTDFEIDQQIQDKIMVTACPSGFLRRKE